jgi:NAD(P)-dependent dehydrogenase (short-subunit alcohol dehydrogenase family)
MNRTVLITGANAGLGKEAARQVALLPETEKVILAVRNVQKGEVAKKELEQKTGKDIFELLIIDVSDLDSVRNAIPQIEKPIDAVILNAAGMGGRTPRAKTKAGVTTIFAANVLGHALFVEELLKEDKLKNVVMYASSEAVRGVKRMGIPRPDLKSSSAEEFASIFDGSWFGEKIDQMQAYSLVKYGATLWMSKLAREYPNIKFISMSPGGTRGTNAMDDIPAPMKIMFKYIMFPFVMPMMGLIHSLETGARRYVKATTDESLESGVFYASQGSGTTGPVIDQATIFPKLADTRVQDNAYEAVHRFLN